MLKSNAQSNITHYEIHTCMCTVIYFNFEKKKIENALLMWQCTKGILKTIIL